MLVKVNGAERTVAEGCSLLDLVASLRLNPEVTVAERNGTIVPVKAFGRTELSEGDEIELIRIVGGG